MEIIKQWSEQAAHQKDYNTTRRIFSGLALAAALVVGGVAVLQAQESPSPHSTPNPNPLKGPQSFIMEDGEGHLGVGLRDVTPEKAQGLRLPTVSGAIVRTVEPGSAAAKAGVEAGDAIIEFDGERVRSAAELRRMIRETPVGRTVSIKVIRDGSTRVLNVTLEATSSHLSFNMPEMIPPMDFGEFSGPVGAHHASLGISADDLTPQLAQFFGVKQGKGVLVGEVTKGGPADLAGIRAGDVIVEVEGKIIGGVEELRATLNEDFKGDTRKVKLTIVRDHHEQTVTAELTRFQIWEKRTANGMLPDRDDTLAQLRAGTAQVRAQVQAEVTKQQKDVQIEWQRQFQKQMNLLKDQLQQMQKTLPAITRGGEV